MVSIHAPAWGATKVNVEVEASATFQSTPVKPTASAWPLPVLAATSDRIYSVINDSSGAYLGKYRKTHIPHCLPGFWEKFYFTPGNSGFPTFETRYARIGVYICYDRHFPEGARALGLHGAEIVFIPSATTKGHADYLWELEQRAHAVANGYFVGTINRVGTEAPWNIGEFFGSSYFCNPDGRILAKGSEDKDELIVADLDLDQIKEVRTHWQFYRDRRADMYGPLCGQ